MLLTKSRSFLHVDIPIGLQFRTSTPQQPLTLKTNTFTYYRDYPNQVEEPELLILDNWIVYYKRDQRTGHRGMVDLMIWTIDLSNQAGKTTLPYKTLRFSLNSETLFSNSYSGAYESPTKTLYFQ